MLPRPVAAARDRPVGVDGLIRGRRLRHGRLGHHETLA
jgi:hypothetical protein